MSNNGKTRIGVFVCHCGTNIANKVNVYEVVEFAKKLDDVVVAKEYKFMCSDPGQELIKQNIHDHNLSRVVVASCSPLMHEPTFRGATAEGGLNPFYFQMANIREHVSWVTADPAAATKKAKALISAAVRRVALHDPLSKKEVPVRPEVLIVGAGIAGIHAALTYANSGKKVYLVEKESSIGGHMSLLDKTFPTLDCSACILTPKMSEVGKHPYIELLTWSEVDEISGFVGSFKAKIRKKARYVDTEKCNGCGDCWNNCPTIITPSERVIRKGDLIFKELKKDH
ncbi:MAG: FAD-dependent oxidoreductase [Candidatus Aminicenantes bacterium]|nr:FAD-dependent oxidoreductase [Candidatus Aminicenantes bacterium]